MKQKNIEHILSGIRAFAFDVDGVMTDGGILADLEGELFRTFNAKDGFALGMASMHGYALSIITGGRSESIRKRALTCGVKPEDVYRYSLQPHQVMYVGDDIPDIPVMAACGLGACPSDAVPEVKEAADYISSLPGGRGCCREVIEMVMKLHGKWALDVAEYKRKF